MDRKVYVNYYADEDGNLPIQSTEPSWKQTNTSFNYYTV